MKHPPVTAEFGQPSADLFFAISPDAPGPLVGVDAKDPGDLGARRSRPPNLEGLGPGCGRPGRLAAKSAGGGAAAGSGWGGGHGAARETCSVQLVPS